MTFYCNPTYPEHQRHQPGHKPIYPWLHLLVPALVEHGRDDLSLDAERLLDLSSLYGLACPYKTAKHLDLALRRLIAERGTCGELVFGQWKLCHLGTVAPCPAPTTGYINQTEYALLQVEPNQSDAPDVDRQQAALDIAVLLRNLKTALYVKIRRFLAGMGNPPTEAERAECQYLLEWAEEMENMPILKVTNVR